MIPLRRIPAVRALAAIVCIARFGISATAAPQLVCTNRVCDFGTLSGTNQIEHVFVLQNHGDADLQISRVRTCCGGSANLRTNAIAPGKETLLEARLSFKGREGKIRKAYYVVSNDPNWPFYKLSLEGVVEGRRADETRETPEAGDSTKRSAVGETNLTTEAAEIPPTSTGPGAAGTANTETSELTLAETQSTPSKTPPGVNQEPRTANQELRTPVRIDYFYEAGCADCLRVRKEILPVLRERFAGQCDVRNHDVGITSNVIMLIQYQQALGITKDEDVSMFVDYRHVFNGFAAISSGLVQQVGMSVKERKKPGWQPPQPIEVSYHFDEASALAHERARQFTLPAVLLAGFIDGLNPCAIGTLVFFMSLLAVSKITGRKLLLVGIVFCFASFLTYMAIGFGLLRFLHAFSGFPAIQEAIEVAMTLLLTVFAFLSFRDAYRFRQSRSPADVSLQLPSGIKDRIHRILREGLTARSLIVGSLVISIAVTALESVCTGQVYVPTLVLVIKTGSSVLRGAGYLLLYNVLFIVPLVAAFVVTYQGLKTEKLLAWSKRNVVPSKILLGLLFVVLAVFMWMV